MNNETNRALQDIWDQLGEEERKLKELEARAHLPGNEDIQFLLRLMKRQERWYRRTRNELLLMQEKIEARDE